MSLLQYYYWPAYT